MGKLRKHHAQWNKLDTRDHILQSHLHDMSRQDKLTETERWLAIAWAGMRMRLGDQGPCWGDEITLNIHTVMVFVTTDIWAVHLKWVNFLICKIYFDNVFFFKKGN